MELSISPRRAFQIGFIVCTLLAGVYLALFMFSIGLSGTGTGDTAELEIYVGQGSLRVEHAGNEFRDDSGFSDGSGTYRYDRTWDESNESVSKNFVVEGGKGTIYDRDITLISGSGVNRLYRVTNIEGDYESSVETTFELNLSESTVTINVGNGIAKLDLRVMNKTDHGPATMEEVQAYGNFTIRSYYSLSAEEQEAAVNQDPLAFCIELDKDNILDDTVPDAVYIAPVGYKMINGKLFKDVTT
ncbi:MAG TPA: hypothetical protein PLR97_06275 [Bacilli bacterium]|nr:hypothetical protein [Bacilli bacterium]